MATAPPSYERQILPRPARLAEPGPNGGEALAEGLGALAQAATRHVASGREDALRIQGAQDRADQINDQNKLRDRASAISVAVAQRQGQLQLDNANSRSEPNTDGHMERVQKSIEDFHDGMAELIGGDPRLQAEFLPRLAEIAAATRTGEERWSIEQRAVRQTTDAPHLAEQLGSNMQTAALDGTATGEALVTADRQWDAYVDRLNLPDNARADIRRDGHRTIQQGAMLGTIERNPQAAVAAIDGGWGADLFTPHERATLRNQAVSQQEHIDALARAATGATVAQADATARNMIEDVGRGVLVDQGQLDSAMAAADAAAAAGGPHAAAAISLAHDLREANVRNRATATAGPLSQTERRAQLSSIEAQPHWQQNPDLVTAHSQIASMIQRDDGNAAGGRLARWSRNTSHPLAPFVLGDAHASAGRLAQARAVAAYDDGPAQLLTDDEADHYRQQWQAAPPAGRAAMLEQIGAHGAGAARMIMQQLGGPSRPELRNLIDLASMRDRRFGNAVAREALDGEAAPIDARLFPQAQAQAVLRANYGAAFAGRDGAEVAGIVRNAGAIYAHRARLGNLDRFDRDLYAASVDAAMGRAGNTGGVAAGHNGAAFALPRGMTSGDFYEAIQNSRSDLIARFSAGRAAPVYGTPEGDRRLAPQELAAHFTPVLIVDDNQVAHYQFRSAAGDFVKRSDGRGNFTVDMRALSHAYVAARGHR